MGATEGPAQGTYPVHPAIRRDAHVETLSHALILIGETDSGVLLGSAFAALAPLLDGTRTLETIVAGALQAGVPATEAAGALDRLQALGLLVEAGHDLPRRAAAWWDAVGASPVAASVVVETLGPDTAELADALQAMGLRLGPDGPHVVLTDDYRRPELEAFNLARLADGAPWLLARPVEATVWLGPSFRPGRTACWACMAQAGGDLTSLPPSREALPSTTRLAAHMIAAQVALLASGAQVATEGTLLMLDPIRLEMHCHIVARRRACPACGDPTNLAWPG
jgi:oxazoline/thiazoline synthase